MEPSRLFVVPLTILELESPADDSNAFRVKSAPRLDVNDGPSLQRLMEGRRQTVVDDTNKYFAKSWSIISAYLNFNDFRHLVHHSCILGVGTKVLRRGGILSLAENESFDVLYAFVRCVCRARALKHEATELLLGSSFNSFCYY